MKLGLITAGLVLATGCGAAVAQHAAGHAPTTPYAGLQSREIKALAPEDMQRLLQGQGMSLALAAELNGYPGPVHVLEHAAALQLSTQQRERTDALMARHKSKARQLGAELVNAERQLDSAFARGSIDGEAVNAMTERIAQLQGKLRAEHLRTHLEQKALLTGEQVQRYQELRGYRTAQADRSTHPHHGEQR